VIRLGDGTEESHRRMQTALELLWKFTGELTTPASYEIILTEQKIATDVSLLKNSWQTRIHEVLAQATLTVPENTWMQTGGKEGQHTEHLGYILSEMQFLQRAYPGSEW
jgi:ring-1,2-phenylacetyl-CoA epoxidase subunit PaaC